MAKSDLNKSSYQELTSIAIQGHEQSRDSDKKDQRFMTIPKSYFESV